MILYHFIEKSDRMYESQAAYYSQFRFVLFSEMFDLFFTNKTLLLLSRMYWWPVESISLFSNFIGLVPGDQQIQ